jgi:NADH dehydrogenase
MPKAKPMVVLVAGGTGFVGKHIVKLLERRGHKVIVHSRSQKLLPTYADVIINLVGIIREDEQTFKEAHVDFTKWLVRVGRKLKVRQFVQMSAIGAASTGTQYQITKHQTEEIVRSSGLQYAIVRPSFIFGPEDASINRFRAIARTGFFPILANGRAQPVHVDTVAQVIIAAAEGRVRNRAVEVGGPEVFTYKQLLDRVHPGVRTFRLPRFVVRFIAFFGEWFTFLPTREQVVMMSQDSITKDSTVERWGIRNPRLR